MSLPEYPSGNDDSSLPIAHFALPTLRELCDKYKRGAWPDKGDIHSYLPIYEEILNPYRHIAKNILEIGLMSGQSLKMWADYFRGDVYGIDCELKPIGGQEDLTQAIAEGYKIVIGDAANPADIEKYFKGIKFDVVVEDAMHNIEQQLAIYETMKPYMAEGALYVIEDIQDIDRDRILFESIDPEKTVEIIDLRSLKARYDDCLVIIT